MIYEFLTMMQKDKKQTTGRNFITFLFLFLPIIEFYLIFFYMHGQSGVTLQKTDRNQFFRCFSLSLFEGEGLKVRRSICES